MAKGQGPRQRARRLLPEPHAEVWTSHGLSRTLGTRYEQRQVPAASDKRPHLTPASTPTASSTAWLPHRTSPCATHQLWDPQTSVCLCCRSPPLTGTVPAHRAGVSSGASARRLEHAYCARGARCHHHSAGSWGRGDEGWPPESQGQKVGGPVPRGRTLKNSTASPTQPHAPLSFPHKNKVQSGGQRATVTARLTTGPGGGPASQQGRLGPRGLGVGCAQQRGAPPVDGVLLSCAC